MTERKQYRIGNAEASPLTVRALLDMLRYVREQTLKTVANHRGHPVEYYTELLQTARARTERELLARDEAWLLRIVPLDEESEANNYSKWFHVCEDEIGHLAQIRWLKKRLP